MRESIRETQQKVTAFVQNVHRFRDAGLKDDDAPSAYVAILHQRQRLMGFAEDLQLHAAPQEARECSTSPSPRF